MECAAAEERKAHGAKIIGAHYAITGILRRVDAGGRPAFDIENSVGVTLAFERHLRGGAHCQNAGDGPHLLQHPLVVIQYRARPSPATSFLTSRLSADSTVLWFTSGSSIVPG